MSPKPARHFLTVLLAHTIWPPRQRGLSFPPSLMPKDGSQGGPPSNTQDTTKGTQEEPGPGHNKGTLTLAVRHGHCVEHGNWQNVQRLFT